MGRSVDTETLDCLKLNIYVPNEATSQNPLPVLVWIHGGVFALGTSGTNNPHKLVQNGIIVVTINYRLGPYGFMCLDVPAVPGNQGLKDQYAALRWVRNNIGAFGGNPYNVTIAGQSAGSCSVLLHLFSSKDKLFHKAIAQSGTPQSEGMFVNGDPNAAIKLANYLGSNVTDTNEALAFLATQHHRNVTEALSALDADIKLRPCTERSFSGVDNFVESDPFSMTNEKKIRNTPILIGHTNKEEINSIPIRPSYYDSDPFYQKIAKNYNLNASTLENTSKFIRHLYIGDEEISDDVVSDLENFESDFIFNHPTQRIIKKILNDNANPVYQYMFSYVGDSGATGAGHSAEMKFLFNKYNTQNPEEETLSNNMVAMWTNFVKYGYV
jgi:carboxylesterase type B